MSKQNGNKITHCLVIGLGRIGLPQALYLANNGIVVHGFDRNPQTVDRLCQGKTPFYEPLMDEYLKRTQGNTFFPCSSWEAVTAHFPDIDAILFAVGTQAPSQHDILNNIPFDLQAYFTLLDTVFVHKDILKKGIKLITRTTLPLGSTDILKNYIEQHHHLQEGEDFYLAFVPERITEGCAIAEFKTLPKIIGVYSDAAFEPISELFDPEKKNVLRVRNPLTAEFCKLTDNSFRSTMFSYANEIAMRASELDVDVKEVISVVNNHYERNHIPKPGFVSGYCLSKDPYIFELDFLNNKKTRDFHSVWYYGRRTNDYLIDFVVAKTCAHIKDPKQSCVVLLGLSFKENVDDFRLSHTFKIMEQFIAKGIQQFKVYDPFLDQNKYTTIASEFVPYIKEKYAVLDTHLFEQADAIILCVGHQPLVEVNTEGALQALLANTNKPCYVFDGWGDWEQAHSIKHIIYERIGFHP